MHSMRDEEMAGWEIRLIKCLLSGNENFTFTCFNLFKKVLLVFGVSKTENFMNYPLDR